MSKSNRTTEDKQKHAPKKPNTCGQLPPFEPTDEQRQAVRLGVAWGIKREAICLQIINPATKKPITVTTLQKHFYDELTLGDETIINQVANSLYVSAVSGKDTRAAMFLLSARRGWRDRNAPAAGDTVDPAKQPQGSLIVPGASPSIEDWERVSEQHRARITNMARDNHEEQE